LNDKRRVIKEKHLMTITELIEVQEIEEMTKQKKILKKNKRKQKINFKIKKKFYNEFKINSYFTNDENVKLIDCIEIKHK